MQKRKKRVGLTIFLILLAVILLLPAAMYGYLALSRFDEAVALDDIGERANAPYAGERVFEGGSEVTVLLTPDDMLWLLNEYGMLEEVAKIAAPLAIDALGFRSYEGGLRLYAQGKLANFLPLPLCASADADFAGGELRLTLRDVTLGKRLHIPLARLAALGVEEAFTLDAGEIGLKANGTRGVEFLDSGVRVTRATIGSLLSDVFPYARAIPQTLSAYGEADALNDNPLLLVAANYKNIASGSLELTKSLSFAQDQDAALTAYLSAGDPERVQGALERMEPFDRHFLVSATDGQLQSGHDAFTARIAARQAEYEGLLTALRDKYRALHLTLDTTGFLDGDTGEPFVLSTLAKTGLVDEESRVLPMFSKDALHAVSTADMPLLSDVPRKSKAALQNMYDGIPYDLGILTKLPSGMGALLYYEATGTFVVNCLAQDYYDTLLAERALPFVLSDDLPRPPTRTVQPAPAEGLHPYEVLMPPIA